jgi:HSP20 family protein
MSPDVKRPSRCAHRCRRPGVSRSLPANTLLSNVTLWARPAWGVDRWVKEGVLDGFTPAAEIVKEGEDAVVRLELPGVDVAKDVNVELDKGRLVIHGERRDERAEEEDGRTLREVRYGSFRRSFKLPAHVTSDAISASYDAGVLTVRVAGAHKGAEVLRIAIESK